MRNLDDVLMTLLVWICSPWRLARAFIFNHEFYNSRWHSNVFVSNVVVATIMIIALVCLIIYVGAGAGAPSEVDRMEFAIKTTWDGGDVGHDPAVVRLVKTGGGGFGLEIEAVFFNDPGNPGGTVSEPFLGLWEYEVVELFISNDGDQYVELEVCPWGQHIILLLDGVRKDIKHSLPLNVTVMRAGDRWSGSAVVPVNYLPPNPTKMNAYAIHGSGTNRIYESLYPVPTGSFQNPDFHRLNYFRPIDMSKVLDRVPTDFSQIWKDSMQPKQ